MWRAPGIILASALCAIPFGSPGTAAVETVAFAASPNALLKHLAGRWAGAGSILYQNGRSEVFKCVTTFFVNAAGTEAQQNFRCRAESEGVSANPRNKVEVKVDWVLDGNALKGAWRETTYELKGTATGEVDGSIIKAKLDNDFLEAALSLEVKECEALATVTFTREIEKLEATGRKC